uniref:(California timema) hypothetical protein n=1 Tax=Timema californicum TaxID=61474 RepID=A0A7R9JL50_TIMCA|nr:unnamed protein product [Timema californicum]
MSHGSKIPYFRGDVTPGTYVAAVDSYLTGRKATDAALIFQTEDELDQTLYYLIGKSIIRVIVLNGLDGNATERLLTMRPSPSYFVIYATSKNMTKLYSKVQYLNSAMYSKRYSTTRVSCRARVISPADNVYGVISPSDNVYRLMSPADSVYRVVSPADSMYSVMSPADSV